MVIKVYNLISIMKIKVAFLFTLSLVLMTSCGSFDRYNAVTEDTNDLREGSGYVYGDGEDKPPRQAAQTYPASPEAEAKAIELRKKMFEDGTNTLRDQAQKKAAAQQVVEEAPADTTTAN